MKCKSLLCVVLLIAAIGLNGCIGNKQPEFITSEYGASIVAIDDVTAQHPEMLGYSSGWYDPASKNKVVRYVDSNTGTVGRKVTVYLVWAEQPSLHLGGFLTQNQSYYWADDNNKIGYIKSPPTSSGLRIWSVNLNYDIPPTNEIPFCSSGMRCMGLDIIGAGNTGFDIRFVEPDNTGFQNGFS